MLMPAAKLRIAIVLVAADLEEDPDMTPKTKAALGFVAFAGLIAIGGFAYEQYQEAHADDPVPVVPDSPSGRQDYAARMDLAAAKASGAIRTEGAEDQGLLIDTPDCTQDQLETLVHQRSMAQQLEEHGFEWVRCGNGPRVGPPW